MAKNAFNGKKHGRKSGAGTKASPKPTKATTPVGSNGGAKNG